MMIIPLLVFGAVAILLTVLFRRTRAASPHRASYGGDTWTPIAWADGDTDSNCDSMD